MTTTAAYVTTYFGRSTTSPVHRHGTNRDPAPARSRIDDFKAGTGT